MRRFPPQPDPFREDSHIAHFLSASYDLLPITLEPWGISLFPLPEYRYDLITQSDTGPPEIQLGDHSRKILNQHDSVQIVEPIIIWLAGSQGHTMHRFGRHRSELVWESKRPSELSTLLTDPRLADLLRKVSALEGAQNTVWEHEFAEMVTPLAKETRHYDLVLLLREHGMVRKQGAVITLTDWGRQVADMHSSRPQKR